MSNFFKRLTLQKILLITILVLALILRFWKLDIYPAFNADEAALGYNAYSLIKTGMDEHGNTWPVHFQSFNDFKPGGYVYIILPFIRLFGLNEWSVRLPNAILGVFSVYFLYLLIKELKIKVVTYSSSLMGDKNNISYVPELAAAFLAISPWHIHFSRGGWEVNTATFFIIFALYNFFKFINLKLNFRYLLICLISFIITLYTYHAARIVSPLICLGLVIIYWDELLVFNNFKKYLTYVFISFILLLPLIFDFTKGAASSRLAGVGLLADPGPISRIEEQRSQHSDFRNLSSKVIHNKLINYGLVFLDNWAKHYHGLFLFLSGDEIQRDKVPETGQMYLTDLIWLIIGLWLMSNYFREKGIKFLIYWLLISPFAAALTFQSPHALRSQNMAIPLVVICAIGFGYVISLLRFKKHIFAIFMLVVLMTLQFLRYQHMYWVHMSKEYPFSSQYGVKELVAFLSRDEFRNRQIVVTDRYDQPYILFLFYGISEKLNEYTPSDFQKDHELTSRDGFGFSTVRDFSRFHFYSIKWGEATSEYPNSLIIGTPEEIPDEANIIKRIYGTNGYEYFNVVAN